MRDLWYSMQMPSRNRIKVYVPEAYYHVYNRGLNKQQIFKDEYDYAVFLNLLKRYLTQETIKDNKGREYKKLCDDIELLAFCLQPNHFHLLVYQISSNAVTDLLHRTTVAFTRYFNKRYKRTGPVFQESFKATQVNKDEYLLHISRYIHLNPKDYRTWEFSSLPYYLNRKTADWIRPQKILELFKKKDYKKFVGDYKRVQKDTPRD